MKNLFLAIAMICVVSQLQAQVLHWQGSTGNNWFYDTDNWRMANGQPVPDEALAPSCRITNPLVIENTLELGRMPGVHHSIVMKNTSLTLSNAELLLQIPRGSGVALGGGALLLEDAKLFTTYIHDGQVRLNGKSALFLYAANEALPNTTIDIQSEDSWVYLVNTPITAFTDAHLAKITFRGTPANRSNNGNVRVFAFNQGVAVAPVVKAKLTVYDYSNFNGTSLEINDSWTPANRLGQLNNTISSFKLKKGYMAVMMDESHGESAGKTYIAVDEDLEVKLSGPLNNRFSYIRLVPWKYVSKKGGCEVNRPERIRALKATWYYEWEIKGWSSEDLEFVHLMRGNRDYEWNLSHPNWNDVRYQGNPHFLYLNEPDSPNQGNVPLNRALDGLPDYLALGLRVGSPAYTDNAAGWADLDKFVTEAKRRNLRLDFIAVHYYQKGNPDQLVRRLQDVYDKHQLPIWITELNHGCTWTGNKTLEEGRDGLNAFIQTLDELPFVERYAVFSCGSANNPYSLYESYNPIKLNISGQMYRDHIAPSAKGFTPPYYKTTPSTNLPNVSGDCGGAIVIEGENLSLSTVPATITQQAKANGNASEGRHVEINMQQAGDYVEITNLNAPQSGYYCIEWTGLTWRSFGQFQLTVQRPGGEWQTSGQVFDLYHPSSQVRTAKFGPFYIGKDNNRIRIVATGKHTNATGMVTSIDQLQLGYVGSSLPTSALAACQLCNPNTSATQCNTSNLAPFLNMSEAVPNQLRVGYNAFEMLVNAFDVDGAVNHVRLTIDNQLIREERVAPYEWGHNSQNPATATELLGYARGTHNAQLTATDTRGRQRVLNYPFTVVSPNKEALKTEAGQSTVYPNPAHHQVNVHLPKPMAEGVTTLTDAFGRIIKTIAITGGPGIL